MLKRKTMVLAIISYGILTALTVIRALGGGARGPGRAENHPTDIFEGAVGGGGFERRGRPLIARGKVVVTKSLL